MAVKEKQIVRIIPARLTSFPPETARYFDRRKGMVEEIYVPIGDTHPRARVRWFAKHPTDREKEIEHLLEDLEPVV
ncbi:hypothetical protein HNQ59_000370 [Chitinivorax tropicus]|uniref:Uncharacterized protein n=1 Tax=Chitinivorax tropicus TaxID=714531 RepID=A0A840MEK1_9PROT|nr:hypothetical protein [Chitinivorax tropicus]MBB5017108.1 hypothetical protein [Chitinivorax tropicus]